jgi:hypothetical protein
VILLSPLPRFTGQYARAWATGSRINATYKDPYRVISHQRGWGDSSRGVMVQLVKQALLFTFIH